MSSASVFNPHVLADLRLFKRMDRGFNQYTPSIDALSSVKRNIFGPIDDQCRKFVEDQLQQQQKLDSEYWNFDFTNEVPLHNRNGRFQWEPIPDKLLARPQKRQCFEPIHDISHLYPKPLEVEQLEADEKMDLNITEEIQLKKIEKTKQSLITDFLKSKKIGSHHFKQLKKTHVTPAPNRTGKITRSRRTIRS